MHSQNTTIIALTNEGWVFAYLHVKDPIQSLYVAYRAILEARLVVVKWTMILFAKYSRTPRSRFIPDMV